MITSDSFSQLEHIIEEVCQLLPAQGPITVFVAQNTLQGFEHLAFKDGVETGARIFGCHPFLREDRYRRELLRGRIQLKDLSAVLHDELGAQANVSVGSLITRFNLRLAMLEYNLPTGTPEELRWFVAETDALTRMRPEMPAIERQRFLEETRHWYMRDLRNTGDRRTSSMGGESQAHVRQIVAEVAHRLGESLIENWSDATWESLTLQTLWRLCHEGVQHVPLPEIPPKYSCRHRDLLKALTGEDSDQLVNEILIRFTAAFIDQGFSGWQLPSREHGYFAAFQSVYAEPGAIPESWRRSLPLEFERIRNSSLTPIELVHESLRELGVPEDEWKMFLTETLLALRGWGGMLRQIEARGDRARVPVKPGTVIEFLAVRLFLDRLASKHIASQTLGYSGPLSELRSVICARLPVGPAVTIEQRAFLIFQLAQVCGWTPATLARLSREHWEELIREIELFSEFERRYVFHLSYEWRLITQTLDALIVRTNLPAATPVTPRFQAAFCIDDREESFRRHLEEVSPETETFGAAGFFAVAMYYRGVSDAHYVPLCPIIIRPQHWVEEEVLESDEYRSERIAKTRKAIGTVTHRAHVGSRKFARGALLTATFGVLASIPLVMRVLFPRFTAQVRQRAGRFLRPPSNTMLRLERTQETPGSEGDAIGFSLNEMAAMGERLLREMGLTRRFARIVAIVGHGSLSMNNPHNSAYNCGACGGGEGGPNARAIARILNDPRIRDILATRGIEIPHDTWFVGAYHDTCNESVTFYDEPHIPEILEHDFADFRSRVEEACDRNAHEKSRRFMSAPLNMSFTEARRHVQSRAEDLAQTRPELGHSTTAICIVARRTRTRGLYFDRRAFLVSYDPEQDDEECAILIRLLQAALPVCSGINLAYYFSHVDSPGWGCGTKLPHNITSLVGVMDGAASDLRTGLPWQGVEIHEPVRLTFVIETTPEKMTRIMDRHLAISQLCRNAWVRLAILDPDSNQIHLLRDSVFVPYTPETTTLPSAATSTDWYRGWRDNLGFAVIE